MMSIYTGTLDIEGREIKFNFDGKRIELINETTALFPVPSLPKHFEIIYGKCTSGNSIVFFDVNYYQERASIVASGWALSNSRDSLDAFDSIRFTGKPIDAFFPPKYALQSIKTYADTNGEQFDGIQPKPRKAIVRAFDFQVNGKIIHGRLDVGIVYNQRTHERAIGEITSMLTLSFPSPQPLSMLPQYYLYIFDLMSFISFRGDICFDSITLHRKNEMLLSGNEKITTAEFFVRDSAKEYSRAEKNVITFEDVAYAITPLIEHVAQRRLKEYVDSLFIPQTDQDYRSVDYRTFLSCALSFEGEFNRRFGKKKASSDALFSKCKQEVINAIEQIKAQIISCNDDRETEVKDFCGRFKQAVEHIDFSLAEKFEYARNEYSNIVDDYFQRFVSVEHAEAEECWGGVLSKMRNKIGHGTPLPLERKHAAVFQMTRCLIYVLILDSISIPPEKIKHILSKLF